MIGDVHTPLMGSRSEGLDYCCLEHAALECLTVPVVVHDAEQILYSNPAARRIEPAVHSGASLAALTSLDTAESSAERRRFMLDSSAEVGDIVMKVPRSGGGFHVIVTRGVPFTYEQDRRALVQLIKVVDGDVVLSYEPARNSQPSACSSTNDGCIHRAAFEVLPVPSSILDAQQIYGANCEFRRMVHAPMSLRGKEIAAVLHPDFVEAGAQRRHLVIDLGAPVEGASVKFRAFDSTDIYAMIDACRIVHEGKAYMVTLTLHATSV